MTETAPEQNGDEQALADGYPSLSSVLSAIPAADDVPEEGIRRIEVNCFASGDATFNIWTVDEVEPRGGYLDKL